MPYKDGGIHNGESDVLQYNTGTTGYDEYYPDWFDGAILIGSADSVLSFYDIIPSPDQWHIGSSFGFFHTYAFDSYGNGSSIFGINGITNIYNLSPVPEPPIILLILVGFAFFILDRLPKLNH